MMVKAFNILVVIASILFIVSCNESNNSEKESFVQICTNADESLSDKRNQEHLHPGEFRIG